MSLHVLRAGAGVAYLLRNTTTADTRTASGTDLGTYYLETVLPAGVWIGSGLAGLADEAGLPPGRPGDVGTLFGRGHDPVTGAPLGRGLVHRRRPDGGVEVVGVSGYDLTFTVPKSGSVLWGLGGASLQEEVLGAHHMTIDALLGWAERGIVLTRVGHGGTVPLYIRGLIGVRFDHWDSRAGDPNLHSHIVIANRVQGDDAAWRALDGTMLHKAAVAMSELYDVLLADELTRRLGVEWVEVDRGPNRNPGFEIKGVDQALLGLFSSRAHEIAGAVDGLVADFISDPEGGRPRRPGRCPPGGLIAVGLHERRPEPFDVSRVVQVDISESVVATMGDDVYLRVGDEDRRLTFEQRRELMFDKGQAHFEASVVPDITRDDLDEDALTGHASDIGASTPWGALQARSLVDTHDAIRVAAVVGFARSPDRWFPHHLVRVIRYRGMHWLVGARQNITSDKRLLGPLGNLIPRVREEVLRRLPTRRALTEGGTFENVGLVPEPVWLEAVVNTIIQRSYSNTGDRSD